MTDTLTGSRIRSMQMEEVTSASVDEVVDLRLDLTGVDGNPFDVDQRVVLRGPGSALIAVPVFFDPPRGFVARVSFPAAGEWTIELEGDATRVPVSVAGRVHANAHGALRIDPEYPRHFVFDDGTHWFARGYEVDWLLMIDQRDRELTRVRAFLDSIGAAGFNYVTVNAYARSFRRHVPEDLERDPRWVLPELAPWIGGNESPDYAQLDPEFFAHMDDVMVELHERGVIVHIMIHVYNKDVNWPELGSADDDRFWRHMVARYQAFTNVLWDTAKESYHQEAPYIWSRIGLIRRDDGYDRLVTAHDANIPYKNHDWGSHTARYRRDEKELTDQLVDVISDQILIEIHADAVEHYTRYAKPYLNVEFGYESGIDDLPSDATDHDQPWQEVARRHWQVVMGGAYPNYYYRNTAWSLFIPFPEPPGYAAVKVLADVWDTLPFWRMDPADHLVLNGNAHVRAEAGRTYVVYLQTGGDVELELAPGTYDGSWIDPFTGDRTEVGAVRADGVARFTSPSSEARVLVLRA